MIILQQGEFENGSEDVDPSFKYRIGHVDVRNNIMWFEFREYLMYIEYTCTNTFMDYVLIGTQQAERAHWIWSQPIFV